MLKWPKNCWNLHDSNFIMFLNHSDRNWVIKCLSLCYLKSYDCFLRHWLPMTSILFLIRRVYWNQFACNYLRNKTLFLNFLLHFWNLCQALNILKNRMTVIAYVFLILRILRDMARWISKKSHSRTPFSSQHVKGCQTLLKYVH